MSFPSFLCHSSSSIVFGTVLSGVLRLVLSFVLPELGDVLVRLCTECVTVRAKQEKIRAQVEAITVDPEDVFGSVQVGLWEK